MCSVWSRPLCPNRPLSWGVCRGATSALGPQAIPVRQVPCCALSGFSGRVTTSASGDPRRITCWLEDSCWRGSFYRPTLIIVCDHQCIRRASVPNCAHWSSPCPGHDAETGDASYCCPCAPASPYPLCRLSQTMVMCASCVRLPLERTCPRMGASQVMASMLSATSR